MIGLFEILLKKLPEEKGLPLTPVKAIKPVKPVFLSPVLLGMRARENRNE